MNTGLAAFHKKQADEKEHQRELQFYEDMKDAKTIADSLKREDNEFMSYAERAVSTWQAEVSFFDLKFTIGEKYYAYDFGIAETEKTLPCCAVIYNL
jgi:hypothetical protein